MSCLYTFFHTLPFLQVVIPIPDTLIGYVIGRGGTTIKEIRQQSRAMIKISDKQPGANERIITITVINLLVVAVFFSVGIVTIVLLLLLKGITPTLTTTFVS